MSTKYSPQIVTNGLVLALDAANTLSYPRSGTSWTDLSGNVYNGTLNGTPTLSKNSSLFFNGSSQYAIVNSQLSSRLANTQYITIGAWVYSSDTSYVGNNARITQYIFVLGDTTVIPADGFSIRYASGRFGAIYNNSNGTNISIVDTSVAIGNYLNQWNYVTITTSGNYFVNLYRNGQKVRSTNYSATFTQLPNFSGVSISSNPSINTNAYWNGNIANIHVYNRGLTDDEVLQNYNVNKSRFGL